MSEEIKITYRPIKEIVILERISHTLESLLGVVEALIRAGQPAPPLCWAEGIIFLRTGLPYTRAVLEERLKGTVFWEAVSYASMPEYKPIVKVAGVEIPVIDASVNPILREVARWLKEQK